jgi:ADP-heptose:LPS heptosyltransferase
MNIKYIVRKRQLGDVLWIEPIIDEIALKYKKVIVHTKYNEIFNNYIHKNVFFKKELNIFEKILHALEIFFNISILFISLENTYEKDSKKHILNAYQKKSKLEISEKYPKIYFSEEERMKNIVHFDNYVVIHLESFSTRNYRKVYGIEWDKITSYLTEKGFKIILIGKNKYEFENTIYIKTNLREAMLLINKAKFFIGIDSFPSHVAASLGIPALIFFGAINPAYRHFKSKFKGEFLQQKCEFNGCYHTDKKNEVTCSIVGNEGIPKCSLHDNNYILKNIEKLIIENKL